MIKIAVFNQKGGVGKTTLTVNLASCFSERWKKKVLVCDCDAQCNSTEYLLETSPERLLTPTIYDSITEQEPPCADLIAFYQGKNCHKTNISLIKGDKRVDLLDTDDARALRNVLAEVDDRYDFCFLDCSAQKTTINLLALGACDFVLVPVVPDIDSINGYDMVLELSKQLKSSQVNPAISVLGIVVNDVATVGALDGYLLEQFGENFEDLIFKSTIRHSLLLRQARFFGLPINYYKRKSNVTLDYYACALEIMERASTVSRKVGK